MLSRSLAAWLAGVVTLALSAVIALAGRADYVGSATCTGCHVAAGKAWAASAHAGAAAALGPRPKARCLGCHTTGDAPAGASWFAEVGCEACHGAGAGDAEDDVMRDPTLSRHLGLRDLSSPEARAQLCARCHRTRTRRAPFDLEAALEAIRH